MRKRERSRAALEPVVAVLPGDAVENDRCELVHGNRKIGLGDVAQDGASGHIHRSVVLGQRTRGL